MSKRSPETLTPARSTATYPTHAEAGTDRRTFLKGLGALVAATGLGACGGGTDGVPVTDGSLRGDGPRDTGGRNDGLAGQPDVSWYYDSAPADGGVADDAETPAEDGGTDGSGPDADPDDGASGDHDADPDDAG